MCKSKIKFKKIHYLVNIHIELQITFGMSSSKSQEWDWVGTDPNDQYNPTIKVDSSSFISAEMQTLVQDPGGWLAIYWTSCSVFDCTCRSFPSIKPMTCI